jgi:hypothetical protein
MQEQTSNFIYYYLLDCCIVLCICCRGFIFYCTVILYLSYWPITVYIEFREGKNIDQTSLQILAG